jgi:hypothetical protein
MTANPAAGTTEDPAAFRRIARAVEDRLMPRDVIESSLCRRIAVAIWRLERAVRVEAAASRQGEASIVPSRIVVQDWIERISEFWRVEHRWVPVPESDESCTRRTRRRRVVFIRPRLGCLDAFRESEIMRDGAAMSAMLVLIEELMRRLEMSPRGLNAEDSEKLAWLLGETAARFPVNADDSKHPHPENSPTQVLKAIGEAVSRPRGDPVPELLTRLVEQRIRTLCAQRLVCEVPFTVAEWNARGTMGLLPDAGMLDRILRYETHADRSLNRALDTLAKLRGAMVESVAARLRGVAPDGTAVEVREERTLWTPGTALAGK